MEGGSYLVLRGQLDGLAHAVRASAIHQRRQNAAVGGAGADILECDVAGVVGEVGDK